MTTYFPDDDAIDKEQREKKAEGYISLEGRDRPIISDELDNRMSSVLKESIAAGLIWEEDLGVEAMLERGVNQAGEKFFVLSNNYMHLPWKEFYIKPGELLELIRYLDSNPQAIKAKSEHKQKTELYWREKARRKEIRIDQIEKKPINKEKDQNTKPTSVAKINLEKEDPDTTSKDTIDTPNKNDNTSPSAIIIVVAFFALIPLTIAKVVVEDMYGTEASEEFIGPILIAAILFPALFVSLRFIFKRGIGQSPKRIGSLALGLIVFLILGSFLSNTGGSGTFCAYIVGCT